MVLAFAKSALSIAFSICIAGSAFAQTSSASPGQQGRPAPGNSAIPLAVQTLGSISPRVRINAASFATGAVGLRNRGDGGVNISGVGTPMKAAFAYWAVVTQGPPTAADANIFLKKGAANGPFATIQGAIIGTGASPCWSGDRTTVYRGAIPLSLANGNGLYLVRLRAGANGATDGESPWTQSNPPLFEGVSIVLIGTGSSTILVYDAQFAGKMFFSPLTYKLISPVSVAGATEVLVQSIGADGQSGVGVQDDAATAGEVTVLNGHRIAGPGSPAGSGDWNGSVAAPLPQLWDNTTRDVTAAAKAGANPKVLSFAISAPDDCLVTVANLLSIR